MKENNVQAVKWYIKAAEQGYADAQYNLAYTYEFGEPGVPRDIDKAIRWYRKAAAKDHPEAQERYSILKDKKEEPILEEIVVPERSGFITDYANMFSREEEAEIELLLSRHSKMYDSEIVILAIPTVGEHGKEAFIQAIELEWGVGEGSNGYSVLLFFVLNDTFPYTSVSSSLLDDVVTKEVINDLVYNHISPSFQLGQKDIGIRAGVMYLKNHLATWFNNQEAKQQRRDKRRQYNKCNAEPGTREYTRLINKGVCPIVNWRH